MTDLSVAGGLAALAPSFTAMTPVHADVSNAIGQVAQLRASVENAAAPQDKVASLAAWTTARDNVRQIIATIDPAFLFGGLDARVPLALLPVRLETRYADPGTDVLRVRIFPDEIHVDGHDIELTPNELTLGTALWAAPADILVNGEAPPIPSIAPDSPSSRRALWAALVRTLGGPRAAWVAQATRPVSLGGNAAAPASKTQAYIRPAVARALPDRWLVRAYVGDTVVGQAWTGPIGAAPHMAPDPQFVPSTSTSDSALPPIDPEMRWLLDYETAVNAGMAVDVPLPQGTSTVDRVIAVGVRASTTPTDAATELAGLLTAHRYTDGLGFLAVGSPTSNNPDAPSARDRHIDPDELWQHEFGVPAASGSAAALLATALGIPESVADGTQAANDAGDARAHAMQTALWAATWGYYLGELLDGSTLGADAIDSVRTHFLTHVRGRGTLPTLRVGKQPYGVLPVIPLDRWTADGASTTVDGLAQLLTRVRPLWQHGIGSPVTASEGPSFDAEFTKVMSTDAVARGYSVRSVIADRTIDPMLFTGVDAKPATSVIDSLIATLLNVHHNPLILDIYSPTAEPVRAPFVVDPADKAPTATVQAAINSLAMTNPRFVLAESMFLKPTPAGPPTVLHTLLRRSLLLEYANAGITIGGGLGVGTVALASAGAQTFSAQAARPISPSVAESLSVQNTGIQNAVAQSAAASSGVSERLQSSMFVGLTPDPSGGFVSVQTLPSVLNTPLPSTDGIAAGEYIWRNRINLPVDVRRTLDETLAAFGVLATLEASELEVLLPETLDLATHRWTSWAESVAAEKLARLRSTTATGISLGGWGVVEGVTRRTRVAVDPTLAKGAATGSLWEELRNGGFVHAPSTAQAATAAVLRAGHLAHGGDADPTFATDLSSSRARIAVQLAQGIAAGQELGALLGYEIERYLHEHNADVLIDPLRSYAPRWKSSGTYVVEGTPEDIVSPSAVVDGLALALTEPTVVAANVPPVATNTTLAAVLSSALAELQQHQHALADLLNAEALHHVLSGNTARAAAVLDASHRGGIPPTQFDVLRTPRTGNSVTSRVAVLLPPLSGPMPGGWPETPRGAADSAVELWLANNLPAWSAVHIRVADSTGAIADAAIPSGASLGLLDLVLDQPEVIRTRIELALPVGSTLVHGRDPNWHAAVVSLDEVLTVASDLREVLAVRSLRQADFLAPGTTPPTTDERDAIDLRARLAAADASVQAALTGVANAISPLDAAVTAIAGGATPAASGLASAQADASAALIEAISNGVVVQLPQAREPADILTSLYTAQSELTRRLAIAQPAPTAPTDDVIAAIKELLGSSQPALPLLTLDPAVSAVAVGGLTAGDSYLAADPDLASDWLVEVSGVRTHPSDLVAAVQSCDAMTALKGVADHWRIVDAAGAGTKWIGSLSSDELAKLPGPAATIVLHADSSATLAAGQRVSGLLVDEWVEVVPSALAATSVAYEADAPVARAPQAIVLGLAPNVAAGWDVETIVDLVRETVDLAKLRTVDSETGAWIGRMLPAVLLPDGDATDVIAAPAFPLLQVEVSMLEASRALAKEFG